MNNSIPAGSIPHKSLSKYALIGLIIVAIMILAYLVYFSPENFLKTSKQNSISPTIVLGPKPFSLAALTPVPSGNQFEQLVLTPGTDIALYSFGGRVVETQDVPKDKGILFTFTKTDGTPILESLFASYDMKPLLITAQDNKTTHISVKDVKKGDAVIVSYNVDVKTKKGFISGMRITR